MTTKYGKPPAPASNGFHDALALAFVLALVYIVFLGGAEVLDGFIARAGYGPGAVEGRYQR